MDSRKPFVLLDNARAGQERFILFRNPVRTIAANNREGVNAALDEIERATASGLFAAGYFSYELGYALEPRLAPLLPEKRDLPLVWFGLFERREEIFDDECDAWLAREARGCAYAGPLMFGDGADIYARKFARVKDYIAAGDIYQANLTFQATFPFVGDPLALYARLRPRARAGHGAYIDDGERQLLSLSPELFFTLEHGRLTARPMKGTAPRGGDAARDAQARARLQASEKDRAENLMIVDLIRNDLGRVARTGTVAVDDLFAIETYPTVHQMVSTVHAEVKDGTGPADIVRALLPCGSVTGTPKIRAMEIIRELEPETRGVYCGAIGAFAPDGSASFNVAIRTITITGNRGRLGIGGAVVADSTAHGEYEECLLKARYFTDGRPKIGLIETLKHDPVEGFVRKAMHLARLEGSARIFKIPFEAAKANIALAMAAQQCPGRPARVRLELNEQQWECTAEPLTPETRSWTFAIARLRLLSTDALAAHKTTWRDAYDGELARLKRETGCDEVVFLNECDEVVEGSRTNVFVRHDGILVTPPLSAGCLPGILRQELLATGQAREDVLRPADLHAGAVFLGNSLRGLIEARPVALMIAGGPP